MKLGNIYDFRYFQKKKDEQIIHEKIINTVENGHLSGAVIQLKTHFKEWLDIKHSTLKRTEEFNEEIKSKIING